MKKIFAELKMFRLQLLCVFVSVAAGVGGHAGASHLSVGHHQQGDRRKGYELYPSHRSDHAGNRNSRNGVQHHHRLFRFQDRPWIRKKCKK